MSRRTRPIIPSQAPSRRVPFMPNEAVDLAPTYITDPVKPGNAPAMKAYVVSTFDARPIMATDFQTQSGSDARDTGYLPEQGTSGPGLNAYTTASVFYTVPQGYQAILRDYHILLIPASGELLGGLNPIFGANGESNFRVQIAAIIDGSFALNLSGLASWGGGFGDIFGECYILANGGSVIEFRVFCPTELASSFFQALISLHGNLLLSQSSQLEFAPATTAVIPVEPQSREA